MALLSLLISILLAQPLGIGSQPVVATHRFETVSPDTVRLVFDLKISDGWHVYSTSLPKGGPTSAEMEFDTIYGAEPASTLLFSGNEIENLDQVFDMKVLKVV